jgi:hypothetical protein
MDVSFVREKIKESRPTLNDSTLASYISSLRGMFRRAFPGKEFDLRMIASNPDTVMATLSELSPHSKKSRLAVLTVACESCDMGEFAPAVNLFRSEMLVNRDKAEKIDDEGGLTERQESAYMEWPEIIKRVEAIKKLATPILNSKDTTIPKDQLLRLQEYLVAMLYTSIPPRRLLDYSAMKAKNWDPVTDNYVDLKKKVLVFNNYKTAKTYSRQEVAIPPALLKVLKRWMEVHKDDWLLTDSRGAPSSQVKLNSLIQKVFGRKGLSVNILRHSFISSQVHPNLKSLSVLKEIASEMGHSMEEALRYKVQKKK